jgi:hypothetical protein
LLYCSSALELSCSLVILLYYSIISFDNIPKENSRGEVNSEDFIVTFREQNALIDSIGLSSFGLSFYCSVGLLLYCSSAVELSCSLVIFFYYSIISLHLLLYDLIVLSIHYSIMILHYCSIIPLYLLL